MRRESGRHAADGKQEHPMKKILLMGGGEFHDYEGCCKVIGTHLEELSSEYAVEVAINDLDRLRRPAIDAFDIIIFYWTKDHLTPEQKHGLLEWCAEKGKFIGIHCAATAFRDCPEYEAMLGGRFRKHPPFREYYLTVDPHHPAMRYFDSVQAPPEWSNWSIHECKVEDEQFLIQYDASRINIAATAAFSHALWPVAWSKSWGNGKVYYLALGHDVGACSSDFFKHMLFAGIRWVDSPEPEPFDGEKFTIHENTRI